MSRRRKSNNNGQQSHSAPTRQHPPNTTIAPSFSWRDHPIVVAAIASIGTFTLITFAFKEIIIPTQIADIQNKIRDLPILEQNIETLKDANAKHLTVIESLKRQVESLQQKDLLELGDPFPALLRKVKLGQPISDVERHFSSAKISKEDVGYWSADFGYGVISSATYYFDEKSEDRTITHILYWLSDDKELSEYFLQDRLTEALGDPSKSPRENFYEWNTERYNVFVRDTDSYIVMGSNMRPGYWPE